MILINRTPLRRYNHSHQITFNHIAYENLNFHRVCVFPLNIFVMVPSDTGIQQDYIDCRASGEHLLLKKDHFYFVPCGLAAEYNLTTEITFMTFHFNLELYPGMDIFSGMAHCLTGYAPEMTAKFRMIFDDSDMHRSICRFKSAVMDFCIQHWPEGLEKKMERSSGYESVFNYIQTNISAELSVEELADHIRMTKEAFSRKFHRELGETPKTFLQRHLLRRIMTLLSTPGITVREVSKHLKFSSEFYLSRFFKKQTGMTPSEYQKGFKHGVI